MSSEHIIIIKLLNLNLEVWIMLKDKDTLKVLFKKFNMIQVEVSPLLKFNLEILINIKKEQNISSVLKVCIPDNIFIVEAKPD